MIKHAQQIVNNSTLIYIMGRLLSKSNQFHACLFLRLPFKVSLHQRKNDELYLKVEACLSKTFQPARMVSWPREGSDRLFD